jgi:tRNA nucleotidyltransferase/poly(A) polymerase
MMAEKFEKLNLEKKEIKTEQKIEEKELFLEKIPLEVKSVLNELEKQGYEAYIVGGCVRDVLLGEKPKDFDATTNAKPEEIRKIFPQSFYENKFGTVTVVQDAPDPSLRHIEITPYRMEGKYTDKRHPDEIKFAKTLEQDLERRDFTVNAMAARIKKGKIEIKDIFNGKEDLKNKIIRAVGEPKERFQEDALRLMRAPRFAASLGFKIEKETKTAIKENAGLLSVIAKERIRDEFLKIIESDNPSKGIKMLSELKLFSEVFPEIEKEFIHKNLRKENFPLLEKSADTDFSIESRLALFFLDLKDIQDKNGIKLAEKSLRYLRVPNRIIKRTGALLRGSNFVDDFQKLDKIKARRLWRLLAKRKIDRKAERLMEDFITLQKIRFKGKEKDIEKKEKIIFETSKDPLFLKDIEISGRDILETAEIKPGPKVGKILNVLLEQVIENPKRNKREALISQIKKIKVEEFKIKQNKKWINTL